MTAPQPFRQPAVDFKAEKIDSLLVTGAANVRYLTGFTGSNGIVLVASDGATLFTDPRYQIQAAKEASCRVEVVRRGGLLASVASVVKRKRLKRIGFEKAHLSYDQYAFLDSNVPSATALRGIGNAIELQRMVKQPEEIAAIRESVLTNSRAFDRAVRKIRPGITESDIAAELEYGMRRFGAEKPAFDTIVAAGPRTALPHARPGPQKIRNRELVLIDMGATRSGYSSDMTRMLFVGRGSHKIQEMYKAVLDAQLAAIGAVREGVAADRVDRAARAVLKKHGLDRVFIHSTGHGLGLEIHEPPRLGKRDRTRLAAGMAITIEPGAYIEDFGGIRIEDTVVVTKNGCDVLTPTPKELIAL